MPEPAASDGSGVVGWVHDAPVTAEALDSYLAGLASEPVGERLGLQLGPAPSPGGEALRRAAVRGWAAKSLLMDRLLEHEAARVDVKIRARPTSGPTAWRGPATWSRPARRRQKPGTISAATRTSTG